MSEVNRYVVDCNRLWKGGKLQTEVDVSVVLSAEFDRVTAERDAALVDRDYCKRVAEHNKEVGDALQVLLTAADERADVLETALRKIKARLDAYAEADMRMPEPSVEVCQMIAGAALKPAEGGGDA